MKYLAAYSLLALAGKTPTVADIQALFKSTNVEFVEAEAKRVVDALAGKHLHEVISQGLAKVGGLSFGGAGGASAPAAGGAAPGKKGGKDEKKEDKKGAAPPPPPPKKEEPAPKVEEEEDVDMGGLFGDF